MTCADRDQNLDPAWDQDLLLLAHGALPPWPRLRVRLHLLRCEGCRDRLARLMQTSVLLAAAVRDPGLPAWSRAGAVFRAKPNPALWRAAAAGLLAVVLLSTAALVAISREQAAPARAAAASRQCK